MDRRNSEFVPGRRGSGLRRVVMVAGLLSAAGLASAQPVRYDGHRAVRAQVRSAADLKTVLALTDDVWSHRTGMGGPLDVRMSPEQLARLASTGIPFSILQDNIQAQIDREAEQIRRGGGNADGPGWFGTYHDLDAVRTYCQDLAAQYPAMATYQVAGQSLLHKDIFALRVTGPGDSSGRVQILLNGGQHAREWVSVSTVMYIADQLLSRYGSDAGVTAILNNIEFLFVPVVNPDGYDYTWTVDRLWRKNRRDVGAGCFGVDTNRNWGYQWGGQGAGTAACNDTYRGASAFSEPETQVLRDYTIANPRIRTAVDFHSYSQLIMSPWGYTSALPAQPDASFFDALTSSMRNAVTGTLGVPYTAGPVYTTIYPASGIAVDWWYGARSVYGLTIELRDTGAQGFTLSPDFIVPVGDENLQGVLALADYFMPVRFSLPSPVPAPLTPGVATPIHVSISAGNGGSIAAGSELIWTRIGTSGGFTSAPLTAVGGSLYEGVLPATSCGSPIQFYFEAASGSGVDLRYPPGTAVLTATPYQQAPVFTDDMEIDRGWTVVNDASLTSGAWERVPPVPSFNLNNDMAAPDQDASATGVLCYVTQNGAPNGAAGLTDVDGGPTWLVSPVLDLSGAASALVTYSRWCYSANGSTDVLTTEVSSDDGATWRRVDQTGTTPGWQTARFLLPASMIPTATMRVRFGIADEPNDSLTEAGIDEVTAYALTCPAAPCYANCDGSSVPPILNANDFQCFLNSFAAGDAYANCDGSSVEPTLNANDFQCFLNLFAGGCP